MRFTERELRISLVLISNAIEDTRVTLQVVKEQSGISDIEAQAYINELEALERRVVKAIETGDWEPAIDDSAFQRDEEVYEPTEEDLAELDAYLGDAFEHEDGLQD